MLILIWNSFGNLTNMLGFHFCQTLHHNIAIQGRVTQSIYISLSKHIESSIKIIL